MQKSSLLKKIFSRGQTSPEVMTNRQKVEREYVAEALEPRVLYSGAPLEAPVEATGDAAENSPSEGFESVGEFGSAAVLPEEKAETGASVVLTSFDNLTGDEISFLNSAAIEHWKSSGLSDEQLAALESVEISVLDLDGAVLGYAEGSHIFIDSDAAGRGWFVDATPFENEEFTMLEDGSMEAVTGLGASNRIDLLSVLQHEIGHVLGLGDIYQSIGAANVMYGLFEEGERREILMDQAEGAAPLSLEGAHFAISADAMGDWVNAETWIGGNGVNWTTDANWADGSAPVEGEPFVSIVFDGNNTTVTQNQAGGAGGRNVNSIVFDENAGAFTVSGNSIDMLGTGGNVDRSEVINLSTNTQTINTRLIHRADLNTGLTFNAEAGDIIVGGDITQTGGTDSDVVRVLGGHTVTFSGDNTYTVPTNVGVSVVSDDFESYGTGNGGADSNWQRNTTGTVQVESSDGNKHIAFGYEGGLNSATIGASNEYRGIHCALNEASIVEGESGSVSFDALVESEMGEWYYGVTETIAGRVEESAGAQKRQLSDMRIYVGFVYDGAAADGKVNLVAGDSTSGMVTLATGVDVDQWHNVELLIDNTANTFEVYLGGVQQGGTLSFDSGTGDLDHFIAFGGGGSRYDGQLDNVEVQAFSAPSTLLLNGQHTGAGDYLIGGGSTFGGTGTTDAAVQVTGILSAGDPGISSGVGSLATGPLTFLQGATFHAQIDGDGSFVPGLGNDVVTVTGDVVLGDGIATLAIDSLGSVPAGAHSYTLINNTSGVTSGFFKDSSGTLLSEGVTVTVGGLDYQISYSGGEGSDVVLSYGSVLYVNPDLAPGAVADGDDEVAGDQPGAVYQSISDALAAAPLDEPVTLVINEGDYSAEDIDLSAFTEEVTLKFIEANSSIKSLTGGSNVTVELGGIDGAHSVATYLTVQSGTFAGEIIGDGGLVKTGAGTLTLSGGNTYAGSTSVDSGVLLIDGSTATISSTDSVLLDAGTLQLLNGATVSVTNGVSNDVGTGNLFVDGGTMTVGGGMDVDNLRVGRTATGVAAHNSSLAVQSGVVIIGGGSGNLDIGREETGGAKVEGNLDLSGASSVTIDVTNVRLGTVAGSNGGVGGELKLSATGLNTVTATSIVMGDSPSPGNEGVTSSMVLGGGTNDFNVDTFTISNRKSKADVTILTGGILNLTGDANGAADLYVGRNNAGTGTTSTGVLNLAGGTFNATLDDVYLGQHSSVSGKGLGTLTFDSGTLNANRIYLGNPVTSDNPLNTKGTFNQLGGSVTVANGVFDGGGSSVLNIDNGTFTVTDGGFQVDDLRVGYNPGSANLTVSGGDVSVGDGAGQLLIGFRDVASPTGVTSGVVNFAAADSVTIAVTDVLAGYSSLTSTGSVGATKGSLTLSTANENTVVAENFRLGYTNSADNQNQTTSLHLGGAGNTFEVDTFIAGDLKTKALVDIVAGGTFTLRGNTNSEADLVIGNNSINTGTNPGLSHIDLSGGTFEATLNTLEIGLHGRDGGSGKGALTYTAGTVTANSIVLADTDRLGISTADANTTGTLNLGGGVLDLQGGTITEGGGTETFTFTDGVLKDVGTIGFALNQAGGTLQIGADAEADTLTIQGDYELEAGGSLEINITDAGASDLLNVEGSVVLAGLLDLQVDASADIVTGTEFLLLDNDTSSDVVSGTFLGLAEGATIRSNGHSFQISYLGGDGNDVVLTALNDSPVLSSSVDLAFKEESFPIVIDSGLTLTDIDGGPDPLNFQATAEIVAGFVSGEDLLGVSGALNNVVATVSAAGDKVTFSAANASATVADFEAALRLVSFENTSDAPDESLARKVKFDFYDGLSWSEAIQQNLATFDFNDGNTVVDSAPTNLTLSNITVGGGANLLGVTTPTGYSSPLMRVAPKVNMTQITDPAAALAESISKDIYFEFTVNANGEIYSMTQLSFDLARGASSGQRGYAVRSSVDGFTDDLAREGNVNTAFSRPNQKSVEIDLESFAGDFSGLTTDVTFRVYFHTPQTGNEMDIDNLVIEGTIDSTVTISVEGVNDEPVANDDAREIDETGGSDAGESATITGNVMGGAGAAAGDVADIDLDADDDPTAGDGSVVVTTIEYTGSGAPYQATNTGGGVSSGTKVDGEFGTLTINPDGSYEYVLDDGAVDSLNAGETRSEEFTYEISDSDSNAVRNGGDLLAEYSFENLSSLAANPSGTGNDGTITRVGSEGIAPNSDVSTNAPGGWAATFDENGGGSTQPTEGARINVDTNGFDFNANDWTISGFYNRGDTDSTDFILLLGNGDGFGGGPEMYLQGVTGSNNLNLTYIDSGGTEVSITVAGAAAPGDWHHYSIVKDAANGISLYVDGTFQGSDNTFSLSVDNTLTFGGHDSNTFQPVRWFNGSLDDLSVVTRALDAGEVSKLANGGGFSERATLTITVNGANDNPVANDDAATAIESGGISNGIPGVNPTGNVMGGAGASAGDVADTDADGDEDPTAGDGSVTVTNVEYTGSGTPLGVNSGGGVASGTKVDGEYGTLTINPDGSYFYEVDQSVADSLDSGETATEVFTYTIANETELARYDLDPSGSNTQNSPATSVDGSISVSGLQGSGSGSQTFISASSHTALILANATASTQAGALDGSNYFEFTVTPTAGEPVSLSSLEFNAGISGGNFNNTLYFQSSIGGFGSGNPVLASFEANTFSNSYNYPTYKIDLGSEFENIATPVTFRFTWSDDSGSSTYVNRLDDLVIYGAQSAATADLTITVEGRNDNPVANDDANIAVEASGVGNGTLGIDPTGNVIGTVGGTYDAGYGDVADTDVDAADASYVTEVTFNGTPFAGSTNGGGVIGSGESILVDGAYGTLEIFSDGSYQYSVNQALADELDHGDSMVEEFVYTISDGQEVTLADYAFTGNGNAGSVNGAISASVVSVIDGTNEGAGDNDSFISGSTYTSLTRGDATAADQAGALIDDDYFEFTITPQAGQTISLTSFEFDHYINTAGSSIGGGTMGAVHFSSSLDGFASALHPEDQFVQPLNGGQETSVLHLGSAYRNLTTPVTFRFAFSDDSSGTSFINRLDDLVIKGIVGEIASDSASLNITVQGTNDLPDADNDTAIAVEAGGLSNGTAGSNGTGNVLTNDSDVDDSDSGNLDVVAFGSGTNSSDATTGAGGTKAGNYGTLQLNADGSFTYIVDETNPAVEALDDGDTLTDTFTYAVTDQTSPAPSVVINFGGVGVVGDSTHGVGISGAFTGTATITTPHSGLSSDLYNLPQTDSDAAQGRYHQVRQGVADLATPMEGDVWFSFLVQNPETTSYGGITLNPKGNDTTTGGLYPVYDSTRDFQIVAKGTDLVVGSSTVALGVFSLNETHLVVGRVVLIDGVETIEVWVDPDLVANPALPPATYTSASGATASLGSQITSLGLVSYNVDGDGNDGNDGGIIDNVVLGGEMLDVTGVNTQYATLTVTIQGANDNPIARPLTETVYEDGVGGSDTATGNVVPPSEDVDDNFADNSLNVTSIDFDGDAAPAANVTTGVTTVVSTYGSLQISDQGSYTYAVDINRPAVQALDEGQVVTEVFTYTITDNNGVSSTSTITVTIVGENDPVIITGVAPEVTGGFVNVPVTIVPSISITDVDDPNMESAVLRVKNWIPGEDQLSLSGALPGGLVATIDNATGTVVITGTASQADYETAIKKVQYTNTNPNPNRSPRLVALSISDGEEATGAAEISITQGFSFEGILSAFRDMRENSLFIGSIAESQDFEGVPQLTLTPFFAGMSTPGSMISLVVKDLAGNIISSSTTTANLAGSWSTSMHGADMGGGPYTVEVTETLGYWGLNPGSGVPGGVLSVYPGGAVTATQGTIQNLNEGIIFGRIVNAMRIEELIVDLISR